MNVREDPSATTIRSARIADVPRLRQLGVLGWETTYTDFIRPENRAAYLSGPFWSVQTLSRVVVDDIALVAEGPDGEVVGFVTVEPYAADPERLEVTRFYVHPDWRRSGVGSTLLAAILERIERTNARALMVNVFARNTVGRAFYERAGFQLVEIVPVVVGDQVDEDAWYALSLADDKQAHSGC
jgi:ribosomal protein S18 acetylase RimI-like enzyme